MQYYLLLKFLQVLIIFPQVKNSGKQVFCDDSVNKDERFERVQF